MPRAASLRLPVLVFVAGGASLAAEMTGTRLLAPFFGASNLVWANVIGLILIYLSVGYWLGGRLADRHPTERALGLLVLVAAAALAVVPFATRPLFSAAQGAFEGLSAGAFIGSFIGAMLMFALPITALGAVSPWAVRLSVRDVRTAGEVSGRLYALSTIGAIVGTFLSVLLLIPEIGTRRTLLLIAALLALAAVPLVGWRAAALPALIACLIALPLGGLKGAPGEEVLFEGESAYQFVQVARQRDGDVVLRLNEGWALHSLTPRQGPLTGGYWDAFATLPLLTGRPDGRMAVLGNAGGTLANIYAGIWPRTAIDGVEIDPLVSDVGRRYMGMNNPRLSVHTADARFWLQGTDDRFDAIVVDAYRQPYIPFHLATREFFHLVRERLRPGGVVAINIGTPPDETEVVDRIAQTMRAEFPAVLSSRFKRFNSVVIGFTDPADAAAAFGRLEGATGPVAAPARQLAQSLQVVPPGQDPLTDDHAPIEWLTDRALLAYLREGAPGS
jgi:spermidine synthase